MSKLNSERRLVMSTCNDTVYRIFIIKYAMLTLMSIISLTVVDKNGFVAWQEI